MAQVVLDMHGERAREGVDVVALEGFFDEFRRALREWARANRGTIALKSGAPGAAEAAASAFRLVEFHTGSGIATLEPSLTTPDDDLALDDTGDTLAVANLRSLMDAVERDDPLPEPVVDALGGARKAMGESGRFGVRFGSDASARHVVIDEERIQRLRHPETPPVDTSQTITGRLHLIEAELPNRRVNVRDQKGVDWTCTYPDALHPLVKQLVERLVRINGPGRLTAPKTGKLVIEQLDPVEEHAQDALFTIETVPVEQLRAEQRVRPQNLAALVDEDWEDDEAGRRYLEAVLGDE